MNCTNCGHTLFDDSYGCSNCHGVEPTQTVLPEKQSSMRNPFVPFIYLFYAVLLLVGGLLYYFDRWPIPATSAEVEAYHYCRDYLEGQVKFTLTAHFDSFEKSQVYRIRDFFSVQTNFSLRGPSGSQTVYVCVCFLEQTLLGGWTVLDSAVDLAEDVTGNGK